MSHSLLQLQATVTYLTSALTCHLFCSPCSPHAWHQPCPCHGHLCPSSCPHHLSHSSGPLFFPHLDLVSCHSGLCLCHDGIGHACRHPSSCHPPSADRYHDVDSCPAQNLGHLCVCVGHHVGRCFCHVTCPLSGVCLHSDSLGLQSDFAFWSGCGRHLHACLCFCLCHHRLLGLSFLPPHVFCLCLWEKLSLSEK